MITVLGGFSPLLTAFECVALSLWIMFSYFEWKVVLRIVGEGRKGACPAVQSGPA